MRFIKNWICLALGSFCTSTYSRHLQHRYLSMLGCTQTGTCLDFCAALKSLKQWSSSIIINEKRSVFFDWWTQLSRTRQLKNESVTDEIFYTQNTSWTKNVLPVCVFLFHLCPLLLLGLHSVHYWGYATGH